MAGFAVTPSEILKDDEEIDLVTLVDKQDALAAEARQALPYAFDECTYSLGALRQRVFSCLDCGEKGVCYGCSISCHAGESNLGTG
jgi:E3 ubiquitin-protein ligase UBR7